MEGEKAVQMYEGNHKGMLTPNMLSCSGWTNPQLPHFSSNYYDIIEENVSNYKLCMLDMQKRPQVGGAFYKS
jgi:hypothetical protein